jgi:NADP-dependent 3-hydroxy acid dehydrogenase YdfG
VVIITGASRGIGKTITLTFAKAGATLVLAARTEDDLLRVASTVEGMGCQVLPVRADVTVERDVSEMVTATLSRFGRVDILINNAGGWMMKSLQDTSLADWERLLNLNVTGAFLCSKAVVRPMIEQGGGQIIIVASVSGLEASAMMSAYCASKFGVTGFARAIAEELRPYNIRVHVICPGEVANSRYDHDSRSPEELKMLSTSDVADLALYLSTLPSHIVIDEVVIRPRK